MRTAPGRELLERVANVGHLTSGAPRLADAIDFAEKLDPLFLIAADASVAEKGGDLLGHEDRMVGEQGRRNRGEATTACRRTR